MAIDKTNYINYYNVSIEEIKSFGENKPSIALHACCGPCACFPIEFISKYFSRLTIIFTNSNIYPSEEYERRLTELKKVIKISKEKYNFDIELVEFPYDNKAYNKILDEYGDQDEGLDRCKRCYKERMLQAYRYADVHNFDYFATVMTISRQKNSQVMNEIGKELSKNFKTKYFYSDFKKNNGQLRASELRKEYDLYAQQYCGCIYSYARYLKRLKEKEEQNGNK